MSYVIAAPEMMTSAATDLATIGSDLSAAHLAAAAPTVSLVPAAADEVSAAVTHLFSQHAATYQAGAAQAAAFQEQFVQHLHTGAFSYASIEAALASLLHDLNVNPQLTNGTRHAALVSAPQRAASGILDFPTQPGYVVFFLQFLEAFIAYLAAIVASLPPWKALLFLLLSPVDVPLLLFSYAFQQL